MKKRILSVLITVVMLIGMLPTAVFAAETTEAKWAFGTAETAPDDSAYTYSGTLAEAFTAANGNEDTTNTVTYVKLNKDVSMTHTSSATALTLNEGKAMVLDLNSKTYSSSSTSTSSVDPTYGIKTELNSLLTVKNGTISVSSSNNGYAIGIKSKGNLNVLDCTIEASKENAISGAYGISYSGGVATITNCTITATSVGDRAQGIEIGTTTPALTIADCTVNAIGGDQAYAFYANEYAGKMEFDVAGTITATCENGAFNSKPTTNEVTVTAGEAEGTATDADASVAATYANKYVKIEPVKYDLYIGGVQVTSANKDNIVVPGATGSATYDPETSTLTLNTFSYTGEGYNFAGNVYALIYSQDIDLKIVLKGTNTLAGADMYQEGIIIENGSLMFANSDEENVTGSLKLTAGYPVISLDNGSLSVENVNLTVINTQSPTGNPGDAIFVNGNILIINSDVTAISGDSDGDDIPEEGATFGITTTGSISVANSTVSAIGYAAGIWAGSLSVANSTVTAAGNLLAMAYINTEEGLVPNLTGDYVVYAGDDAASATEADASADATYANKYVKIEPVKYDLYIGGVQFTSGNLVIDSTDSAAISGSATYTPELNTLILNNFQYSGPGYKNEEYEYLYGALRVEGDNDLRIVFTGQNVIECTSGDERWGLYTDFTGDLHIKAETIDSCLTFIGGDVACGRVPVFDGNFVIYAGDNEADAKITAEDTFASQYYTYSYVRYEPILMVTFDYGTLGSETKTVLNGETVTPPAPVFAGKVLVGWYTDSNFTTEFNFSNAINADNTTIYAKFADYEDDKKALQDAIDDLETAVDNVETALDNKVSTGKLTEEVGKLNIAIQAAKDYADTQDAALKAAIEGAGSVLNTAINALKDRVTAIENQLGGIDLTQIATNKTAIETLTTELATVKSTVDQLDNTFINNTELTNALAALKGELEDADDALEVLITALTGRVDDIEDALDGIDLSQIATNKQDIIDLTTELGNLDDLVNTINTNYASADANLQTQITALDTKLTELIDETIAELTDSVNKLKDDLNTANGKININTTDVGTLKTDVSTLKTWQTEAQNAIEALETLTGTQGTNISVLQTTVAELQATMNTANGKIAAAENRIAALEDKVSALETAKTKLENAVSALQTAVADKADTATVNAAIAELKTAIEALEAVKNNYIGADDDLRTELEGKIATAKGEAIASAETLVNNAKAELQSKIDAKADAATTTAAIQNLQAAVAALEAVKDDYATADATLKTELEGKIETAKSEAITAANTALTTAKNELSQAIALKADTAMLNAKVDALNTAIANAESVAKAYADTQDAALKAELQTAIANAKSEAIGAAQLLVDNAKAELQTAIDTKADTATVNAAIANMQNAITALEAAKDNYASADAALKLELEAAIERAKQEAIEASKGYIPYIGTNGNWWIGDTDTGVDANGIKGDTGEQGPQGEKGDKGDTGATGNGIASITTSKANGITTVTIKFTDPNMADVVFTIENGADGAKGDKGDTGAQGAQGDKGDKGDTGAQGEKGDKGNTGAAGADGVGIANIEKTSSDGNVDTYTITLANGTTYTFTVTNGTNGTDGKDGKDGTNGKDGVDGKDGTNGTNGVDGKDGANGADGQTPYIGENGNWWIGDTDTGVKAAGDDGKDGAIIVAIAVGGTALISNIALIAWALIKKKRLF